jgi:predicted lactoylglutathione lyase
MGIGSGYQRFKDFYVIALKRCFKRYTHDQIHNPEPIVELMATLAFRLQEKVNGLIREGRNDGSMIWMPTMPETLDESGFPHCGSASRRSNI